MSIDPATYRGFGDELIKIGKPGLLKAVGNKLKAWTAKGWHDPFHAGKIRPEALKPGAGWMTEKKYLGRRLPLGVKSWVAVPTAMAVPGALNKEDPLQMGRSATERTVGLAAETAGGLTGAGAMLSLPFKRFPVIRSIAGGVGGAILGGRMATAPWRRAREQRMREQAQQAQQPQQPAHRMR